MDHHAAQAPGKGEEGRSPTNEPRESRELGVRRRIVGLPAFLACPGAGTETPDYMQAYSPLSDLVNLQVVNGRLVVTKPFYEGFKTELVSRLSAIGSCDGTSLRFIDDWMVYHRNVGEVHCGTAVKRDSERTDWWVYAGQ
ncbi:MAG: hypothetical protein JSU86_04680 [Phycisphaerales bacterium]|nr:MAG: hypothetical protein JSU86_04680 [Phycisphaerales bacterium]